MDKDEFAVKTLTRLYELLAEQQGQKLVDINITKDDEIITTRPSIGMHSA